MIFTWESERNGRQGIVAKAEGYDAVPWLSEFWLDRGPERIHPDRFALAAALVFGDFVGGRMVFPGAVSIGLSRALKRMIGSADVDLEPVLYEQKAFPAGDGQMFVHEQSGQLRPVSVQGNAVSLHVVRSDQWSGSMTSFNESFVASNAFLHASGRERSERAYRALLAVGVLFAEDLGVDVCSVSGASMEPAVAHALVAAGFSAG